VRLPLSVSLVKESPPNSVKLSLTLPELIPDLPRPLSISKPSYLKENLKLSKIILNWVLKDKKSNLPSVSLPLKKIPDGCYSKIGLLAPKLVVVDYKPVN
jgi:hypothetical protein